MKFLIRSYEWQPHHGSKAALHEYEVRGDDRSIARAAIQELKSQGQKIVDVAVVDEGRPARQRRAGR